MLRLIASAILSIIMYLIVSFVKWNLVWIIQLPNYAEVDRFGMMMLFLVAHALFQFIVYEEIEKSILK